MSDIPNMNSMCVSYTDHLHEDLRRGFQKVVACWRTIPVFGLFWRVFVD